MQEMISAYLDQELTGRQMLEMRAHLGLCPDCARECRETGEMRRLLRALRPSSPDAEAQMRLNARLTCPEESFWATLASALSAPRPAFAVRPALAPGGRRLAAALAISCVAILTVAPPFAPPIGDAAISSGGMATLPPLALSPLSLPMEFGGIGIPPSFHMTLFARRAHTSPPLNALPDVGAEDAEPLRDVTAVDYEQGNVALADYQESTPGVR